MTLSQRDESEREEERTWEGHRRLIAPGARVRARWGLGSRVGAWRAFRGPREGGDEPMLLGKNGIDDELSRSGVGRALP